VAPAGNALWISSKSSPAKQSAAFEFISYLDSTDSQTAWAAGTGYIPLRVSSAQSKTIQDLWNAKPYYKVAYTSITSAPQSYATSGPVIGPFADVRTALASAEASMFVNGTSPEAALKAASAASDAAITSYDQRLGVN
jgi:sn-glycerol 3-phosphate transport system substrate-binding protein